jgi:hypothetical protein
MIGKTTNNYIKSRVQHPLKKTKHSKTKMAITQNKMKKLNMLLFGLVLISTTTFISCKKCATCTQTITTSINVSTPGYPQTSKSTFEACDKDLDAVNGKTTTATSSSGSVVVTATSKTTCN